MFARISALLTGFVGKGNKNEDRYSLYSSVSLFFLRLFFFSSKRTAFYEQLSSLLKADIALYDACVLMRDKFLKHKTLFKSYWLEIKVLNDLIYRISAGLGSDSIASILDGLVPESDLVILSVDSRKTIDAFDQVTLMMSKFNHLRLEVAKMFFTPVASLILVSVLIFVANWLIFPIVLNIKPFNELPEVTQNLYVFCHFFASNIGLILSVIISLILAVIYSLPRLTGLSRKGLDFIPPYNIYKQVQATSFLISLSLLLQSGDDFNSSIHKIKTNASNYLAQFLDQIHNQVALGDRSGEAIAAIGLFNKDTQIYIEILDESYALARGLSTISDRSTQIQIKSIKHLMGTISTLLLFSVIAFGLWFYVGIGNVGLSL
jgi:type II secretory pathway component PulF